MKKPVIFLTSAILLTALYVFIPFESIIKLFSIFSYDGKIDIPNIVILELLYRAIALTAIGILFICRYRLSTIKKCLLLIVQKIETTSSGKWLFYMILVAVLIRVVLLSLFDNRQVSDFMEYHEYAKNIAEGKGYIRQGNPTAWFPIGYPLALSVLYSIFGANELYGKLFNILISLMIVTLIFKLSCMIFNETTAKLASFFFALWPNFCAYTLLLNTDLFFTFLLTVLLYLLVLLHNPRFKILKVFFCGIIFACATLTRSLLVLFSGVILVYIASFAGKLFTIRFLKLSVIFFAGAIIIFLPWWIRNYNQFGKFIPLSTNGGFNFWLANVQLQKGNDPTIDPAKWPETEYDINRFGYQSGLMEIKNNPFHFVRQIPVKILNLFIKDISGFIWISEGINNSNLKKTILKIFIIISQLYYLIMITLFLPAIYFFYKTHKPTKENVLLIGTVLYWIIFHSIYFGKDRFHLPLIPVIAVFSSYGVYYLITKNITNKETD